MRIALVPLSVRLGALLLGMAAPALAAPTDGGTQLSVQVAANGDSTVEVARGELAVKAGGKETRLRGGEGLRAPKGKPLKKLLATPNPTTPVDKATLAKRDVEFAWQPVPGAARYLIEVSSSPELSGATLKTVDGTRAVLRLTGGSWFWRVTALDGDGTPGRRGQMRQLTVDNTPPRLKTGRPQWR